MVKKFYCGLCKVKKATSRKGLRDHLKSEHRIIKEIANMKDVPRDKSKQDWWIKEEW